MLCFLFIYFVSDYFSDCTDHNGQKYCGKTSATRAVVGYYFFLLPACVMAALPCCGNELRENPKPFGEMEIGPFNTATDWLCKRYHPAQWFMGMGMAGFFVGVFLEFGLKLVFMEEGQRQRSSPWFTEGKSSAQLACGWVGRVLQYAFAIWICVGMNKHKHMENERFVIRSGEAYADEYEAEPGPNNIPWPHRYTYDQGNLSIQLPPPGAAVEVVTVADEQRGSEDVEDEVRLVLGSMRASSGL